MIKISYYNISTIEIDIFLFHVSIVANLDFIFFMHLLLLYDFFKNNKEYKKIKNCHHFFYGFQIQFMVQYA
jgi:hypothetical protein